MSGRFTLGPNYKLSAWLHVLFMTGFPDDAALLHTGGRTRPGLALMVARTPLQLFSANPGGAAELMSQRARGYLCSGVLKRHATSR